MLPRTPDDSSGGGSMATTWNRRLAASLRGSLGVWRSLRGEWSKAAEELAAAAEIQPKDALYWLLLGNAQCRLRWFAEAWASYQQALAARPEWARAYAAMGRLLMDWDRPVEAVSWLRRAVQDQSRASSWWWDLGQAEAAAGHDQEALSCLDRAVDLGERSESLWLQRAVVLARLGRYREAVGGLKRGLLHQPQDVSLLNNLGVCLAGGGHFEEALPYYLRAVALESKDPELLLNLALCLQGLDRHAEALEYLERAGEAGAEPASLALALVRTYIALDDVPKALASVEQALHFRLDGTSLLLAKADLLLRSGKVRRAEAFFRYVHRLEPERPEPLWGMARCLESLGHPEEAVDVYNRALEAEKQHTA